MKAAEKGRFRHAAGGEKGKGVPVGVFAGDGEDWLSFLRNPKPGILFFDEDYPFVHSREFAREVAESEHYFVLITRKPLHNLPYSIREVYGIRTTGKFHFPEQVYNEFYPLFPEQFKLA